MLGREILLNELFRNLKAYIQNALKRNGEHLSQTAEVWDSPQYALEKVRLIRKTAIKRLKDCLPDATLIFYFEEFQSCRTLSKFPLYFQISSFDRIQTFPFLVRYFARVLKGSFPVFSRLTVQSSSSTHREHGFTTAENRISILIFFQCLLQMPPNP